MAKVERRIRRADLVAKTWVEQNGQETASLKRGISMHKITVLNRSSRERWIVRASANLPDGASCCAFKIKNSRRDAWAEEVNRLADGGEKTVSCAIEANSSGEERIHVHVGWQDYWSGAPFDETNSADGFPLEILLRVN